MKTLRAILLALLLISIVPAWAESVPDELTDALDPEAIQLLDELKGEFSGPDTLMEGFSMLWTTARGAFLDLLRGNVKNLVLLMGVVLLCSVASELYSAAEPDRTGPVHMAGALSITALTVGSMQSLIGLGSQTLERLDLFAKTLLPTLSGAVAASGGVVTAGAGQVAAVFFSNVLLTLIRSVLLPLMYCYIAVAMADAALPEHNLKQIRTGIAKAVTWGLAGLLLVFTGFLKICTSAGASADSTAVRLTRSAISAAVPVVGGIISDASETVASGAMLLKNTVGVFGALGIIALCLMPFVRLAVQFLLYKLTAFLASSVGPGPLVELIDALGTAFGLVLGMVGAGALLLLISVISSVSVVVT